MRHISLEPSVCARTYPEREWISQVAGAGSLTDLEIEEMVLYGDVEKRLEQAKSTNYGTNRFRTR
ncbi:MAG: hypothetical protein HY695_00560 [Deltaproteobacteria bacterium]|nr:hypothetical protein [Deltaproteobacteria bacterium]